MTAKSRNRSQSMHDRTENEDNSEVTCKFCGEKSEYDAPSFPCCKRCWEIGFDEEMETFDAAKVREEVQEK